jgi:dihydrofolate reductase
MRNLIAGMKISADQQVEGPEGYADWVEAWSDDYDVMSRVDACLLGAGMYPGYEQYWTTIQNEPDKSLPMTGKFPTPDEIVYARFATQTPHYVLSRTLTSVLWPNTTIIEGLDDIAALKQQPGKDIYLVGGARTTASLIDASLVDELRLIVYPLIAGGGRPLFAAVQRRRELHLRKVEHLSDGCVGMTYRIG